MDPIKEAFQRIKEEMGILRSEVLRLAEDIKLLKESKIQQTIPTQNTANNVLPFDIPTHIPTSPQEIRGLKITENGISTGNKGVPTDTSTNKPTNQQTDIFESISLKMEDETGIENIQKTLDSLDNIKKEIRLKFKRLTSQEMLVFSTIYTLEARGVEEITYKVVASDLNLSESSIRDYVIKLSSKGIPIIKQRLNNKQIALKIAPSLQKIASLSTIIKLRGL